jgi:hypothetical protein
MHRPTGSTRCLCALTAHETHTHTYLSQALAEKRVAYTPRYTDLFNGQSLSHAFLALNPAGTVPCLVIEGGPDGRRVLSESRWGCADNARGGRKGVLLAAGCQGRQLWLLRGSTPHPPRLLSA